MSRRACGLRRYRGPRHLLRTAVVLAVLIVAHGIDATAQAAESYDNCTGFIDSLPATITTQGTWCLRDDLSTAVATGNAITVAANNVTLDCNDFKVGGLAAGAETQTTGIGSLERSNVVVRNCAVRGFSKGVWLRGGSGHVVEDNRFDGNTWLGISISFADTVSVRRNQVVDTGGNLPLTENPFGSATGISISGAHALVLEHNSIGTVFATDQCECTAVGISVVDSSGDVRQNQVFNLMPDGSGSARGVQIFANGAPEVTRVVVRDNVLVNRSAMPGHGIWSGGPATAICRNNTVVGFATAYDCADDGGNSSH